MERYHYTYPETAMPSNAIDSLLALMGRSRNPQLPPVNRMSDVDLTRIQGAALTGGDRGKADRVSEIRALRAQELANQESQDHNEAIDARLQAQLLGRGKGKQRAALMQRLAAPRNALEDALRQ